MLKPTRPPALRETALQAMIERLAEGPAPDGQMPPADTARYVQLAALLVEKCS